MLKIAFASDDRIHVNLHFGGAEQFVLYDVSPGQAELVGIGTFKPAVQKGENAERPPDGPLPAPSTPPAAEDAATEDAVAEDKVAVKLEFLAGCTAVYAASIGASGIRRLVGAGIQPIIVDKGHEIVDLLNEVSLAIVHGGLGWVTRAAEQARARRDMETTALPARPSVALLTEV